MAEKLSLSPELIQLRHWIVMKTAVTTLSRYLVGKHSRVTAAEPEQVLQLHVGVREAFHCRSRWSQSTTCCCW